MLFRTRQNAARHFFSNEQPHSLFSMSLRLVKAVSVSICLQQSKAFVSRISFPAFQSRSMSVSLAPMPEESIVPAPHQKVYLEQVTQPKMLESTMSKMLCGESEPEVVTPPLSDAEKQEIIDQASEVEKSGRMPVILNSDYSGYEFSEYAINMYKELLAKKHGAPPPVVPKLGDWERCPEAEDPRFRTDALMAKIIENNPRKAWGLGGALAVHYTDSRYKGYIDLTTYDGADRAKFIKSLYVVDRVKEIEKSAELSEREKVEQIHAVLHEPLEPFWVSYGLWQNQFRV